MDFALSPTASRYRAQLIEFMDRYVYPAESTYHAQMEASGDPHSHPPILEELKARARAEGLWNLFLPHKTEWTEGLSNLDYAPLAEIMGHCHFASEVFNCAAPDTGNMEILTTFGTEEQKMTWLKPLLDGEIRSCFAMTEPEVASSDARNIMTSIRRDGDEYVISGRKWWISGAASSRCKIAIVMGKTDPDGPPYQQQSMVLVPLDTPGVEIVRSLPVFGYDDREGHCEIIFHDVRVPRSNLLGEEGSGFAIAQSRLGPGRIHHCMRSIGVAERALGLMCTRAVSRTAFGKTLADQGVVQTWIADSRIEIDQARLLTLQAAYLMDTVGNKGARIEISSIKVVAPNVALRVLDRAIQTHGGGGVSNDFPLAAMWAGQRTLRFADGPDEVHRMTIARRELAKHTS
ncbi:MAG: acyl-CoA dehydrogenase family protein [Acidimicrobiales bacterium]